MYVLHSPVSTAGEGCGAVDCRHFNLCCSRKSEPAYVRTEYRTHTSLAPPLVPSSTCGSDDAAWQSIPTGVRRLGRHVTAAKAPPSIDVHACNDDDPPSQVRRPGARCEFCTSKQNGNGLTSVFLYDPLLLCLKEGKYSFQIVHTFFTHHLSGQTWLISRANYIYAPRKYNTSPLYHRKYRVLLICHNFEFFIFYMPKPLDLTLRS